MNPTSVMITGASGGLGSALAVQFAKKKANLLLLDKSDRGLNALSDEITAMGLDEPGTCPLDLATMGPDDCVNLLNLLEQEYSGLDVLIHCAAVFHGLQPLEQVSAPQWLECMQVNVNSAWLLVSSCAPLLRQSQAGRVIFIQDNLQPAESAYWGAYGVSKAALASLGKIFEEEFSNSNVRVLNINPGPMRTELRARAYLAENPQSVQPPEDAARTIIERLMDSYSAT